MHPSGNTILADGNVPVGRLDRNGGPGDLNEALGNIDRDPSKAVGFVVLYRNPNQLEIVWASLSVNNANYGVRYAPREFRNPIMKALEAEYPGIGLKAVERSDDPANQWNRLWNKAYGPK